MDQKLTKKLISSDEKDFEDLKTKQAVERWGSGLQDPYTPAGVLSRLILYWAFKVIKLGNLIPLKTEYFGKLTGKYSSVSYLKSIKYIWDTKGYKFRKTLPLIQAGFRCNWVFVLFVLISISLRTMCNLVSVSVFREYMRRFSMTEEEVANEDNIYKRFTQTQIGIATLAIKLFEIFLIRKCNEYQSFLGYKSGAEFQCLIFEKLLKVSPSSMKERAESGQVANFIQIDAHRLTNLMLSSPDLLTIPAQIIGYSYMLFKFFGVSFLLGIGTMIIFMIINVFFTKKLKLTQKKQMMLKDKRMKVLTETFNNIKVLKLYSWEEEYMKKIQEARENELQSIIYKFNIHNYNSTIQWFAPVATSLASIGMYQYLHTVLKIEDIFTCMQIFNSIQHPIKSIPTLLNNFSEVAISMGRIEKYLFQDEINQNNIIKNDKEMKEKNMSVKIVNGNYSWGIPPTSLKEIKMKDLKDRGINMDSLTDKKKKKKEKKEKKNVPAPIELSTEIKLDSDSEDSFNSSSENLKFTKKINDIEGGLGIENLEKNGKKKINPLEPILKDINIEIKNGEFVCIIGEVGCGKSSLLQAILNNMLPLSGSSKVFLNGDISYVSQIPWIQNATIKDNILFYSKYDEEHYNEIIDLSQLRQDLEIFEAGDLTEIGEKGVNLSGGQKARISIARALYVNKDIYIFDDPISALDANVGMKIMKNCILKYLKNKTRILVTHALQYVSFADRIIYMNKGEIKWMGSYEEIKSQDFFKSFYEKSRQQNEDERFAFEKKTSSERREEFLRNDSGEQKKNKKKKDKYKIKDDDNLNFGDEDLELLINNEGDEKNLNKGKVKKIIKEEKKEKGKVKFSVYKSFVNNIGGISIIFIFVLFMITQEGSKTSSDLWLSYWTQHQKPEKNFLYFIIYSLLGITGCSFTFCKGRLQGSCNVKVSRKVHGEMVQSLIRAPISTFHETVPKGQILNRFSSDINSVDRGAMSRFLHLLSAVSTFLCSVIVCTYYEPYSLILVPFVIYFGNKITQFYQNCSRELNRLEGSKRSPVLSLTNEVIPGTDVIRAFGYQDKFLSLFHEKIDEHLKLRIILNGCNQWYDLHLDLLSFIFITFLITFTIIFKNEFTPQAIGIIYNYCDKMKQTLIRILHTISKYENNMINYERCLQYTQCPSEKPAHKISDDSLGNWPSKGKIEFQNFSVRYRPDTEIVLKNISFVINPKEKVGIVGRTGSGKSTITLCLFRILEATEGKIFIDDIDISTIGLYKLRSSLTIIPQDPALIEGTLRYNIDPLEKSSDSDIINVMKKIGFDYIIKRDVNGLLQEIAEGGSNLSVGERQLICITRAILRETKIIVMDEATASIDYKTEEIIQKAISEILNNSTFITIAHRIKTIINYDRIITLDSGKIVDFDTPQKLLNDKKSLFYELYTKSNL